MKNINKQNHKAEDEKPNNKNVNYTNQDQIQPNNNNINNNNLNNTKFLIDDTMGISNNSLFFSNYSNLKYAATQSKLNNTQNLLNDKNSIISHDKLLISNISEQNKIREKYKDLLPEINSNLQNSNTYESNIDKDRLQLRNKINNEDKTNNNERVEMEYKYFHPDNHPKSNLSKYQNPCIKNYNSIKSQNEMYIIENIKEENENIENIETIILTENNNSQDNINRGKNIQHNFNETKDDSDFDDDRKNTNLYCLTNSNIDNKFFSSILETNEYLRNNQRTEKDENINVMNENKNNNIKKDLYEDIFSYQRIEENFELEKQKNQSYLNNVNHKNNYNQRVNQNNFYEYNQYQINEKAPNKNNSNQNLEYNRVENSHRKIISFRNNDYQNIDKYHIKSDNKMNKENDNIHQPNNERNISLINHLPKSIPLIIMKFHI